MAAITPLQIATAKEHVVRLTKHRQDLMAQHEARIAAATNGHIKAIATLNAQHDTNMQIMQAHIDGLHADLSKLDPAAVARVRVPGFDVPIKPKSLTPFPGGTSALKSKA